MNILLVLVECSVLCSMCEFSSDFFELFKRIIYHTKNTHNGRLIMYTVSMSCPRIRITDAHTGRRVKKKGKRKPHILHHT